MDRINFTLKEKQKPMKLNLSKACLGAEGNVPLPRMVLVKQYFETMSIEPQRIEQLVAEQFRREEIKEKVKFGMRIAIGVGSRGIENLFEIVRCTVNELKKFGAVPFIVPAMGSHGGASAEGQAAVLAEYEITEEKLGIPVLSSMETVHLGTVLGDVEVYFDRLAYEHSDGIIVIGRVKPHTDFKAPIESGIIKMLGIGLGKHKGASYLHRGGMGNFDVLLPAVGKLIVENTQFLFGVAIVEDSDHQTAIIELVPAETIHHREEELLVEAKRLMPRFWLQDIDVLVIDEIGKNISGSGFDPNIIGRTANTKEAQKFYAVGPSVNKLVILGLTKETDGNAVGIGLADFTTSRLVEQIDFHKVYTNAITAVEVSAGKLPLIMSHDQEAVTVAVYTAGRRDLSQVRVVRISNTLRMNEILVSENLLPEVEAHPMMEITGLPQEWLFDKTGNLS